LNAAVLGPDCEPGSETWNLFLKDVVREMTQKTGQKCTAVRRILVPHGRIDDLQGELVARLGETVTGHPAGPSVTMGPLATTQQLEDAIVGVARLRGAADLVLGTGERIDGAGAEPGKGFFFGPTLLRARDAHAAEVVHTHEVFGPVATLLLYDGTPEDASRLVALGGGSLVASLYADDTAWVSEMVLRSGAWNGRLYLGSEKMAEQAPGSGIVLPQSVHGGPGHAGGGEELGALRGLGLYMQRVALQGSRAVIDRL
jgi:3,4-dehydroadipyl-CoA semialdehyde dehydrogenase